MAKKKPAVNPAIRRPMPRKQSAPAKASTGNSTPRPAQRNEPAKKPDADRTRELPRIVPSVKDDGARPTSTPARAPRSRTARLRLVHVDPWSVMRTTFLLSIVFGIATVVAVFVIWLILSGAGVWDSINHSVRDTVGGTTTVPFDITDYVGLGRVVGFTMLAAVIDSILFTAIATLVTFLYNLSANLLGGIEATYAEER